MQIIPIVVNDSIRARHYFEADRPVSRQMLVKAAKFYEAQRAEGDSRSSMLGQSIAEIGRDCGLRLG
jgi:hypothetical protein